MERLHIQLNCLFHRVKTKQLYLVPPPYIHTEFKPVCTGELNVASVQTYTLSFEQCVQIPGVGASKVFAQLLTKHSLLVQWPSTQFAIKFVLHFTA